MTTDEFNNQLSEFYRGLYVNAMRLARNKHNAQDLMQETIMRAFASHHKFIMGTNFKAWIHTIMQNCFVNDYRKRKNRGRFKTLMENNFSGVAEQPVSNLGNTIVMMKELRTILDSICEANRVPFELHFNGFGYQEIADQLNIPLGTVKSRIFLARKKLKHIIHGHYGEHAQYA